jgi:phage terminase large subunit-like protein
LIKSWHIEALCNELQIVGERLFKREQSPYDLVVNIPPAMSKSSIFSILFPAWVWTRDPTLQIISASFEGDLAQDFAQDSRTKIIASEKYQILFGDIYQIRRDSDAKRSYKNNRGGWRKTVGTKGHITGKHAHLFIIDDPMNPRSAESQAERGAVNKWLNETVPSRKTGAASVFILVMQRLHEDDSTAQFLTTFPKVRHICLPAILTDTTTPEYRDKYVNGYLDPIRLSPEICNGLSSKRAWAGQYLQAPSPDGGNIINPDWFFEFDLLTVLNEVRAAGETIQIAFCIDGAYTAKTTNDPSVILGYFTFRNKLYITALSEIWVGFSALLDHVVEFTAGAGYTENSYIRVEPKANGKDLIDALVSYKGLNAFPSKNPTIDKIQRVHAITPILQAERVGILSGAAWGERLKEQVKNFPKATHDDIVDCIEIAVREELFMSNQFLY